MLKLACIVVTAAISLTMLYLHISFYRRNTQRSIRENHIKLLLDFDRELMKDPDLWGIFDRVGYEHARIKPDILKIRAFIFLHLNSFLMVYDYHSRASKYFGLRIRRDKDDNEIWVAFDKYINQFFYYSSEARRIFHQKVTRDVYPKYFYKYCANKIKDMRDSFIIRPLSTENLDAATNFLNKVFEYVEVTKRPGYYLSASLNLNNHKDSLLEENISFLEYWTATNKESKQIIAVTGRYEMTTDKEKVSWVGWTAVDEIERGFGLGEKLLRMVISESKANGSEYVKLWTSTHPKEVAANRLYSKMGFKKIGNDEQIGTTEYFKVTLQGKIEEMAGKTLI